ncbi:hypothetical protein M8494_19275 [Serratia ureilytica]
MTVCGSSDSSTRMRKSRKARYFMPTFHARLPVDTQRYLQHIGFTGAARLTSPRCNSCTIATC